MGPEALPPGSSETGETETAGGGGTGATPTRPAEKGLWHLSCGSHPWGGAGQRGSHTQRKAYIQWAGRGGLQRAPISQVRKLRPIQGAGGTEPGSRPRAHRCPRPPGCISCSWAGPGSSANGLPAWSRHPLSSSPASPSPSLPLPQPCSNGTCPNSPRSPHLGSGSSQNF